MLAVVVSVSFCRSGAQAGTKVFERGDRMGAFQVRATTGETQIIPLDGPTVVIFWATWSPSSLVALKDILATAPKGGIRWRIVPINVDAPRLVADDTAAVHRAVRDAGWRGPIWSDHDYAIMDDWGVLSVPTILFVGLGGIVEEIEHDWSAAIRIRLFTLYFSSPSDSFPGMPTELASKSCRNKASEARRLWRQKFFESALKVLTPMIDLCPELPNDIGRYVSWRWSMGGAPRRGADLLRLTAAHRDAVWPLCAEASIMIRQGNCSTAVSLARQATDLDSAFSPAWILLAESAWRCRDTAGALLATERAAVLNRHDPKLLWLLAQMSEGAATTRETVRLWRRTVERRLQSSRFTTSFFKE